MISVIDCIVILLIVNLILLIIAVIVLGIACFHKRDLIYWLPVYVTLTIGQFFNIFQFTDLTYQLIANILFVITVLFIFIAAFKVYYKTYLKSSNIKLIIASTMTATVALSPLVIIIVFFLFCLLLIAGIMLLRIFIRDKSSTYLLFMTCVFIAGLTTLTQIIPYLEVEFALCLSYIMSTIYITILLINGIVAILEQKVIDTLNEKNDIKDRYSHDLGNILHTITMAYDLFNMEHTTQVKKDDLDILIKDKITEASKLVKFIRNI